MENSSRNRDTRSPDLLPDLHIGFNRGRSGGLFQNLSQFIVIHTIKGFDIVNKAEVDVFLEALFYWAMLSKS